MTIRLLMLLSLLAVLPAADLGLNDKGLIITVKGMGEFAIAWPQVQDAKGGNPRKPQTVQFAGRHADLAYAGGMAVAVDLQDGGAIAYTCANPAEDAQRLALSFTVGISYAAGGTWQIGEATAKPFPAERATPPQLFQGAAERIAISDPQGNVLVVTTPRHTYHQVQDNRTWNWPVFQWQGFINLDRSGQPMRLTVADTKGVVTAWVDRFGQDKRKSFTGKIADEAELKADATADAAYYAGFTPPPTDRWGGQPGSKEKLGLKGTGFFRVEQQGERWLLVDPDGNACFHLGICSFGAGQDYTYLKGRREIYDWIPPADGDWAAVWHPRDWWKPDTVSFYMCNLIRKYGAPLDWNAHLGRLVGRVKQVGFNAVGNFTGDTPAFKAAGIPYVDGLGMGPELPGIRGICDPFDDAVLAKLEEEWAPKLARTAAEPRLIGWFFGNEQAFEDIPRALGLLPGKHAAKVRLAAFLREAYPDIAAFNAAWGLQLADHEALREAKLPVTTKAAADDMRRFAEIFLERYYSVLTGLVRKHDPNHLLLGSRWQPGTANSEMLCRIAGKHMDVVSINYYATSVDSAFMKRLYAWCGGKPQMWSEFNFGSSESNNTGGAEKTQRLRGQGYRTYVQTAASLGFVVGVEWFTLTDQSITGRWFQMLNGEAFNTGLFNVCDRPYKDLLDEMAQTHADLYDVWLGGKAPWRGGDPRFSAADGAKLTRSLQISHAPGAMAIDGQVTGWPVLPPERFGGERLVMGGDKDGFEAAFRLCWDERNLYLLADVTDPTPRQNRQEGAHLWNGDGLELFIGGEKPDQPGPMLFSDRQLLLAAASAAGPTWYLLRAQQQPQIEMQVVPAIERSGYVIEAAIPWSALGVEPKAGTELLLDLAVDDALAGGDRIRQIMWNGGQRNSSDRSLWGHARLVP